MVNDHHTILTALVGSQAYGLASAESDFDYISVHVAPKDDILGLRSMAVQDKSYVYTEPSDHTTHEVGKFCRLALKGNPTINEILWMDHEYISWNTISGTKLRSHAADFLSAHTVSAYRGYIKGQIGRLTYQDGTRTPRFAKAARHVFRLAVQLCGAMDSGIIRPRLTEEDVVLITEASALAGYANDPCVYVTNVVDRWVNIVKDVHPLLTRSEPNTEAINDLLIDIRKING